MDCPHAGPLPSCDDSTASGIPSAAAKPYINLDLALVVRTMTGMAVETREIPAGTDLRRIFVATML